MRWTDLGLKEGDYLTFFDGRTCIEVVSVGGSIINVRSKQDEKGRSCFLETMTRRVMRDSYTPDVDVYSVWTLHGETLRSICTRKTADRPKKKDPKVVRRDKWMKDIRDEGNLFFLETCFRFTACFCANYKGPIGDRDVFAPAAQVMSRRKLMHLFNACTSDAVRKEMESPDYGRIKIPDEESPKILLKALWQHPKSNPKLRQELSVWLKYAEETLAAWQFEHADPAKARFEELGRLFNLSDKEKDVLIAAALVEIGVWPCDNFKGRMTPSKRRMVSALLNLGESEYMAMIKPAARLRRLDCLDDEGDLNSELRPYILGMDDTPLANRYFKINKEAVLPWSFFGTLAENHGAFLKQLIAGRSHEHGLNILLYGEPGTGKTSFALALAAELGLKAYVIAQANEKCDSGKAFRFSALQVCDGQTDPDKSLIIVDEADEMLGGSGRSGFLELFRENSASADGKGLLNDVLDTVKTPCVWITNSRAETLDASNRRRFDYSIRFDKLTSVQREAIWRNGVSKYNVENAVPNTLAAELAAKYEISAGGIDLALRNLESMLKNGQAVPAEAEKVLDTILTPHCQLLDIKGADARPVGSDYSLEGLNIKGGISLPQIEGAVRRFQKEQATACGKWLDRPRMNLLLSGPPGTGKTEFVKYLGTALGTRVMTRMGSDLLDKYVGGTEQNIKRVFAEAAAEKTILFLDEVDGIIQTRERAVRSWEVSQVNELLQWMEKFDGVLICATNFVENLDSAVLRRFTFKLTFDYLTDTGKRLFFDRMFRVFGIRGLMAEETGRLLRIPNLTPGDFRTVRQSLYYTRVGITTTRLLDALEAESAMKHDRGSKAVIGFGAAKES